MKFAAKYCCRIFTMVCVLSIVQNAAAQPGTIGVGFIVGEPMGISAKAWLSDETAVTGSIGWSIGGDRMEGYYENLRQPDRFHIHVDYLWHSFNLMRMLERYPVYAGIGARMNSGAGHDESFAFRGVMGIAWLPRAVPIDVFMELIPMLQVSSSYRFGIDAGVGARYFF